MLVLLTSFAQAKYSGGSGTPENPYKIADCNDLYTLADDTSDYNKCFVMTTDIDLDPNLPGRRQLTTALIAPYFRPSFAGTFDGNDCSILNFTIDTNGAGNDYLGLFGQTDTNTVISNLGIRDASITGGTGSDYIGGLAGYNDEGSVTNCYAAGAVTGGGDYVGGLVGLNDSGSIVNGYFLDPSDGGGPDNGLGEPLTDTEMKQQASFIDWDFNDVWSICETTN